MEDPAERLIRRSLSRHAPPKLGPALADDVLRRLVSRQPPAVAGRRASRRLLAVPWLMAVGASVAVLAHLEWSSGARIVAWGIALALVPLTYSATLWPDRALGLLALCSGRLLGEPQEEPSTTKTPEGPAVT